MENTIWEEAKKICKQEVSAVFYHLWIEPLKLHQLTETTAVIKVKSDFCADIVKKEFEDAIQSALSKAAGHPIQISFVASPFPQTFGITDWDPAQCGSLEQYSFDDFPLTRENKLAYTLLKEVAEHPGSNINPLMLCGGTVPEKRYLTFALLNSLSEKHPTKKVVYRHIEQFLSDIICDLKDRSTFRHDEYRSAEFYLLAGIDLVTRSIAAQEELYSLFTELLSDGKQIIIISDTIPDYLRFDNVQLSELIGGGTIVSIQE